jgi:hypothetical protein
VIGLLDLFHEVSHVTGRLFARFLAHSIAKFDRWLGCYCIKWVVMQLMARWG